MPGRVLEVGQQVGESCAGGRRGQAPGNGPSWSDASETNLRLIQRKRLQRAEVGRRLDQHARARVDQHLGREVEALLRAGGDQHLVGMDVHAVLPSEMRARPTRAAARSLRWRRIAGPRAGPRAAPSRWRRARAWTGNVSAEGRPPASDTMPGRSVTLRISRMIDGFMRSARRASVNGCGLGFMVGRLLVAGRRWPMGVELGCRRAAAPACRLPMNTTAMTGSAKATVMASSRSPSTGTANNRARKGCSNCTWLTRAARRPAPARDTRRRSRATSKTA